MCCEMQNSFHLPRKNTYKTEVLPVLTKHFSNASINLLSCIAGEKIKGNFPVFKKNKPKP